MVRRIAKTKRLNCARYSQIVELHAEIFLGTIGCIECDIRLNSAAHTWTFSSTTVHATFQEELHARAFSDETLRALETKIPRLPELQQRPPCQAAMALKHREPMLLIGPASFKLHSVRLMARMLNLQLFAGDALETMMVSKCGQLTRAYETAIAPKAQEKGISESTGGLDCLSTAGPTMECRRPFIVHTRSKCLGDYVHVLGADSEALQIERQGALSTLPLTIASGSGLVQRRSVPSSKYSPIKAKDEES